MTSLFHGSALCEVDPEGNVPVPQFIAEALGSQSEAADLLVSKHDQDMCLIGYDREHLDVLRSHLERWRLNDESAGRDSRRHYRRARRTFGVVEKMQAAGGRMRIPPAMRHLGRIGELALIVGTGDSFEIWNPDIAVENDDEQFRDLAAFRRDAGARGGQPSIGVH